MKKGSEMKVREETSFFTFLLRFPLLPEFSFSLGSISREIRANRTPEGTGEEPKDAWFFSFSRCSSCSSYSLPRERASICRRKDRDKPRVKGRKREEKLEDTGCHEMRYDTLGCSSRGSRLPGEPERTIG